MGRPRACRRAAEYHRRKPALLPVVLDALADLRSPVRRGRLRGRGQPGRDQPARRRHRQPAAWPRRPGCRRSSSATSTGAACSPRCTARWPCCPTTCGRACGGSWSTGCGATRPCWATRAPTSSAAAGSRRSAWCRWRPRRVADIDDEDSLALDRRRRRPTGRARPATCSTWPPLRWPRVVERRRPRPAAPRARGAGALGAVGGRAGPPRPGRAAGVEGHPRRPRLVPAQRPGGAVERSGAAVVAVCAGLQMVGGAHRRPRRGRGPARGRQGPRLAAGGHRLPGRQGAGPAGRRGRRGPGPAHDVAGYRIHHGRVAAGPDAADVAGSTPPGTSARLVGRRAGGRDDAARAVRGGRLPAGVLAWAAARAGKRWTPGRPRLRRHPAGAGSTASPTRWRRTSTSTGSPA